MVRKSEAHKTKEWRRKNPEKVKDIMIITFAIIIIVFIGGILIFS